jgi:TP901 family phage tail tape measure protein
VPSRDLTIRIDGDPSGAERAFKSAQASASVFERELKKVEAAQAKQHKAMGDVGKAALGMGAAMAAGVGLAVRSAVKWESAFAGVAKTTDLAGLNAQQATAALGELEGQLRDLARNGSASHEQIAKVAEAAGQLGIKRDAVVGFTRVMIDLGETTNLTADEAATALARISNIMGTSSSDVDRMGAAIVELGNNSATTEAEIVTLATRLAAAGRIAGLSEADIFAFASTLTSVGVEAEAGGTALSKVFIAMRDAVITGGKELDVFAKTAGVSSEQFQQSFGEDSAGAISMFVGGLGRINEAGESTTEVFDDLALKDQRLMRALLSTAGAGELLNEQLGLSREAWEANSALVEEAEKRYATTEARMAMAKNALNDLAIDLGSTLLPALAGAADGFADMARFVADLPGPLKAAATVVGVLGAVVFTTGGAALIAVPKIVAFKASVALLAQTAPRAAAGVTLLSTAMTGLWVAAAGGAVLAGLFAIIDSFADAGPEISDTGKALIQFGEDGRVTGALLQVVGKDFENLADKVRTANSSKWWSFTEGRIEVQEARNDLESLSGALVEMVNNGQGAQAAEIFARLRSEVERTGGDVGELEESFADYAEAQRSAAVVTEVNTKASYAQAEALSGVDTNLQNAYASLGRFAEAQGLDEEQTKSLTKQVETWADSLGEFVQPLGAYTDLMKSKTAADRESAEARAKATKDEKDSWEDYVSVVTVSVSEYLGELERQVEAQEKHADNMMLLAGRVSQGTLDELARMGPEGAPLVAELVNASDKELEQLDDLFGRRTSEATGAMAGELYLANTLLPKIASLVGENTALALATSLAKGTTTVAQIAKDYSFALEGGLAPLLQSLGVAKVQSLVRQEQAQARRPRQYADGGVEEHTAQIAPAGAWRVWAEPETGGEAYIPLAASKRQRSVGIWAETGRRLGVFADGGFHTGSDVPRPYSTSPYGPPISTAGDRTMDLAYAEALAFIEANSLAGATDLVTLGKMLQRMGFRVSGHAAFGGTPKSGHAPGSYHYRNRAIDVNYGPGGQSAAEMAAIDALMPKFGSLPLVEKLWRTKGHFDHLHLAMAKGGVLNPHVRDSGGPLLPGYTFNGTGGSEMVLPMAAGGIHGGAVGPGGTSLTTATSGMTDLAAIRAVVQAWEDYNRQLEQAARKRDLIASAQQADRDLAAAKTVEERARAQERLNQANQAVRDFDYAAAREREASAVERQVAALQAQIEAEERIAEANRAANQLRREKQNNKYELGLISDEQYLDILQRRMDDEIRYSDAWTALWRERERILSKQAQAERDLTDALKDTLADRERAQQAAFDRLNSLLDQEQALRRRQRDLDTAHAAAVAKVHVRQVEAEAEHYTRRAALAGDFAEREAQIIAARRDALANFTALDQLVSYERGLPTDWLIRNAQAQVKALADWITELDLARRMGLSEDVIAALGLDEGPQALYQLRALTSASAAEIDELNRTVAQRTALAGQQTAREQQNLLGQTGAALIGARQQYVQQLAELDAGYARTQQDLHEQVAALNAQLVVDQASISAELAALGQETGRSYSEALAAGIASGIPAIKAATAAAMAAMAELAAARSAVTAPPPAQTGGVLDSPFKRIGARRRTYDSGGWLEPGFTLAYNGTGRPERVVTAEQAGGLGQRVVNLMPGAQITIREQVDVDLLARRGEWLVMNGSMG